MIKPKNSPESGLFSLFAALAENLSVFAAAESYIFSSRSPLKAAL